MLSVIIPTLNVADRIGPALVPLVDGAISGVVKEVIFADGGSTDAICEVADATGARLITASRGRGTQLAAGAEAARGQWLFFLHADTRLTDGWIEDVIAFLQAGDMDRAAAFRFRLDDRGAGPRVLEAAVSLRCALLGLPYGDQGLLISRSLYRRLGGFRPIPLMEDVDLVRRVGRRRLTILHTHAVTGADRYRRDGYLLRPLRNLTCLSLYFAGVPPRVIARLYG